MIVKKKTLLSWSSGKDSAWTLWQLQQDPDIDLAGLFTVVNKSRQRVAMHAVRIELLKQQADMAGLPLTLIEIPEPCTDAEYQQIMGDFTIQLKTQDVTHCAFGDLYLEDIRAYRVKMLEGTGVEPLFPLWQTPTDELSKTMLDNGLKAIITSVDPKQIDASMIGRFYDAKFIADLPESADPCGENGEFHSFVFDGPMFKQAIDVTLGEVVERGGFYYADVLLDNKV